MDKPVEAVTTAARKRTATARTTAQRKRAPKPATPVETVEPTPATAVPAKTQPRRFRPIAGFGLLAAAAVGLALLLVDRQEHGSAQDPAAAAAVSAQELASFASSHGAPIYWGGERRTRTIELSTTAAGTFVRYLPAGTAVGGSSRALTVATYPLRNAYATATRRAKGAGMTSSPTRNGGLAVWSKARPTSVYVAFRGVPSLVEVYAPQAKEARTLALSSRLRPVQ